MNAGAGLHPLQPPCCCTLRHPRMRGRCQTQHVSTQAPTERAAGVGRARGSCRHRREGGKAARRARARRWAYAQEGWAPIAALAPRVLALSRTDSVAQSIVAAAVKQAGVALAAVVGKCGLQGAFPIVLSGARPRGRAQLAHPLPMAGASCRPAPRGRTVAGQGRAGPARTWQRPGCAQRGSKVEGQLLGMGFPLALCARRRMRGGRRPRPRQPARADPNHLVYPNVTPRQAGCWRAEAPTLRRRCSGTCGASTRAPPP